MHLPIIFSLSIYICRRVHCTPDRFLSLAACTSFVCSARCSIERELSCVFDVSCRASFEVRGTTVFTFCAQRIRNLVFMMGIYEEN